MPSTRELPPGNDALSTERAANLASVCDINQIIMYVLSYNDHLMGKLDAVPEKRNKLQMSFRLSQAFLEQAAILLHQYVETQIQIVPKLRKCWKTKSKFNAGLTFDLDKYSSKLFESNVMSRSRNLKSDTMKLID